MRYGFWLSCCKGQAAFQAGAKQALPPAGGARRAISVTNENLTLPCWRRVPAGCRPEDKEGVHTVSSSNRQTILIVDDSEMNRSILVDMLEGEYEMLEAGDGLQAVGFLQNHSAEIALMLLDIVMPNMDGFGVLEVMNRRHWIESVPVVMISAESNTSRIDQAYEMGITDFISRPFDAQIVHRRVKNTLLLYAKQKDLEALVAEQIYEKQQSSALMVDILSHIVEFRNGESGLHVLHVRTLTELLLRRLVQKTDQYHISKDDIAAMSMASALHDIGKISIDEKILNKPGKLTAEEFAVMKTHSLIGAQMLESLNMYHAEKVVKMAYDICRWHHERYDGRGYPDGLKGDEIPISAQTVALADVYDALTSKRVYKPPFTHEKAVEMIVNGECGTFNPLLLSCLEDISGDIAREMEPKEFEGPSQAELSDMIQNLSQHKELSASSRTLQLLEHERMKYSFFAAMSKEVQFEYTILPSMVSLNSWGAKWLGVDEIIMEPFENKNLMGLLDEQDWQTIMEMLEDTSPEHPYVTYECRLRHNDKWRWFRFIMQTVWEGEEPPQMTGCIGKAVDIHDMRTNLESLERMASYDGLTDLLNLNSARKQIEARMKAHPDSNYALAFFDLDHFKDANNTYGHAFGNHVLAHVAELLRQNVRGMDIAARVGGDEFIIFLEYQQELEAVIRRIYRSISGGDFQGFTVSMSMGVATTEMVEPVFTDLLKAADQALYAVKQSGRGRFQFYDGALQSLKPTRGNYADQSLSPIESKEDGKAES